MSIKLTDAIWDLIEKQDPKEVLKGANLRSLRRLRTWLNTLDLSGGEAMSKNGDKRIQVISDTLWELIKDRDPEEMLKDLDIIEDEVSSFREHAESLKEAMEQEEEGEEW